MIARVWKAVIFDGDDTLWETEKLYDQARQRARARVETAGLDGARWEELEREIDVRNVRVLGHSAERFPTSCAQAYEAICHEARRPPDAGVRDEVATAARAVFDADAALFPHAHATL